jgi:hypothetical protein
MTSKEKAIELKSKYLKCKDISNSYFVIPILEDAKQCALIAVDEILDMDLQLLSYRKYWQEVKQEIEKL